MPLLLHTRYDNIKIVATWTVLHVFFVIRSVKARQELLFLCCSHFPNSRNLLFPPCLPFFGLQQHKGRPLVFRHSCVPCCVCAEHNLCTHIYYSLQLPLRLLCCCFYCITYLLCEKTCRSCCGGVLQPSFRWEHTECSGFGPDIRGGPWLYFKKNSVASWRVHTGFTSLLTVSSEHIVPACVCVFRFLPVSTARFPSRGAA